MPRKPRIAPANYTQHVYNRGINKRNCFHDDHDFKCFAAFLISYSKKYLVKIHAWVFMTNHYHLLCTPITDDGLSKMMQELGRDYTRYFNQKYDRTGSLWEGRFNSNLVDTDEYLLTLYLYIEFNPERAGMVKHPREYAWSSYRTNAEGVYSKLVTEHDCYTGLGKSKLERQQSYKKRCEIMISENKLLEIRRCLFTGNAFAGSSFKDEINRLTGANVNEGNIGRPKGSKNIRKKIVDSDTSI